MTNLNTQLATKLETSDLGNITTEQLGYLENVNSDIQTQLDNKVEESVLGNVTADEIAYLDNVSSNIQTQLDEKAPFKAAEHVITVPYSPNYYKPMYENPDNGFAIYYRSKSTDVKGSNIYFQNVDTGLGDSDGNNEHQYGLRVGVDSSSTGRLVMYGTDTDLEICTSISSTNRNPDPVMTFKADGTVIMEDGHTFCGATNTEIGYLSGLTGNIQNQLTTVSQNTKGECMVTLLWDNSWEDNGGGNPVMSDYLNLGTGTSWIMSQDCTLNSYSVEIDKPTNTNNECHVLVIDMWINDSSQHGLFYFCGITDTTKYIQSVATNDSKLEINNVFFIHSSMLK